MRLGLNIDHVATLRQARKGSEPDVLQAALIAQDLGVDQITVHLRMDRRHIQDDDVRLLKKSLKIPLNVELSTGRRMLQFACEVHPDKVTLVPERRNEVTTEGGLDLNLKKEAVKRFLKRMKKLNIPVSLFIDPCTDQVNHALALGADEIEINTAAYSEAGNSKDREIEAKRIESAAILAKEGGMTVAAGHGLTDENLPRILQIPELEELNIGHHIVSQSIFMGFEGKIHQMLKLLNSKSE